VLADLLIRNTTEVLTCAGPAPRRGRAQRDPGALPRGVVASKGDTIVFVGHEKDWRDNGALTADAVVVDARGGAVMPGFVDPHTHVVFAGDRRDELRQRLEGANYARIAAAGGGILATVRATRAATEEQLRLETCGRLDQMLRCGTTTCEAKSGYGLETTAELKLLGVIHRLADEHAIELSATFMGAHEIPPEYRDAPRRYIDLVIGDMIPAVSHDKLAEWCDVFCEADVFTPDDAREILIAARRAGLKLRIHADEFGPSGGTRVATELGVRSADHLLFVDDEGVRALAAAGVVATLLPAAAFYLKMGRFAPGRALIDAGVRSRSPRI
jgi:imidazolonepropionase